MSEAPDNYIEADKTFCSLGSLILQGLSVGVLATAIEQDGVYGWDRFGRTSEADEKRMSKAFDALALLLTDPHSDFPTSSAYCGDFRELQMLLEDNWDHTLNLYGWPVGVCPDFEKIKNKSVNVQPLHNNKRSERRNNQHKIICDVISALKLDSMKLSRGAKSALKRVCLLNPSLFTGDSFDHAWQAGVDAKLFRLADHDKFSQK